MNFDRTFYVCASLSATYIKNQAASVAQIGRTDFDTLLILQHLSFIRLLHLDCKFKG